MHCLHCHGLEGNGRGPTGPWLNPPPRDYRTGIFKYTSSDQRQNSRKPRRDDILHVLAFGIEGTSMPSFNVLSVAEREQLASYVIHLSIRGDVEYRTMTDQLKHGGREQGRGYRRQAVLLPEDAGGDSRISRKRLQENLAHVVGQWMAAQADDAKIKPDATTRPARRTTVISSQSAARGGKIFYGSCIPCHQNFGRESNLSTTPGERSSAAATSTKASTAAAAGPGTSITASTAASPAPGMASYKSLKADTMTAAGVGMSEADFEKYDPLWDIVNFLRAVPYRDLRDKLRGEPYKINLPD